jgi:hypothetical protein
MRILKLQNCDEVMIFKKEIEVYCTVTSENFPTETEEELETSVNVAGLRGERLSPCEYITRALNILSICDDRWRTCLQGQGNPKKTSVQITDFSSRSKPGLPQMQA